MLGWTKLLSRIYIRNRVRENIIREYMLNDIWRETKAPKWTHFITKRTTSIAYLATIQKKSVFISLPLFYLLTSESAGIKKESDICWFSEYMLAAVVNLSLKGEPVETSLCVKPASPSRVTGAHDEPFFLSLVAPRLLRTLLLPMQ